MTHLSLCFRQCAISHAPCYMTRHACHQARMRCSYTRNDTPALDSPRHAKHKIRLKFKERKNHYKLSNFFTFLYKMVHKKQSFKRGGMQTNDFKKNVSFFRITYQHRVRCIEATKLLPPADRPSLTTLISKFYMRIIFIFNLLKLYYLFISRLNGRVVLLYSAVNLKRLVRAKNQSPYSVTRCCYSYINKLPYFVLRKTNLCSYHGTRSR